MDSFSGISCLMRHQARLQYLKGSEIGRHVYWMSYTCLIGWPPDGSLLVDRPVAMSAAVMCPASTANIAPVSTKDIQDRMAAVRQKPALNSLLETG